MSASLALAELLKYSYSALSLTLLLACLPQMPCTFDDRASRSREESVFLPSPSHTISILKLASILILWIEFYELSFLFHFYF